MGRQRGSGTDARGKTGPGARDINVASGVRDAGPARADQGDRPHHLVGRPGHVCDHAIRKDREASAVATTRPLESTRPPALGRGTPGRGKRWRRPCHWTSSRSCTSGAASRWSRSARSRFLGTSTRRAIRRSCTCAVKNWWTRRRASSARRRPSQKILPPAALRKGKHDTSRDGSPQTTRIALIVGAPSPQRVYRYRHAAQPRAFITLEDSRCASSVCLSR